ncbi:ABC transporter permease [Gulosibacter bifidus]|uniref:ABC transporter permease n=1 Tax=Gulosibacter bifidus TaxID=272239 RepID=A0ABW5RJ95_9MICO|nr:iron ABC transporter permease [Gulosibacter bifidus]
MAARRTTQLAVFFVVAAIVAAVLIALFYWPVTTMLLRGFGAVADAGDDAAGTLFGVLGEARTWRIIATTCFMAVVATVVSCALGIPAAHLLYRRRFIGRNLLRGCITVPFVLPTVVVGVAFRALLTGNGPLGFLQLDNTTTAVIAAMVFFNVSVVVRQVGTMWATIDPKLTEAARTLGAGPIRAFRTVTLPQLAPAIAASAGLVFLFCTTSFGIVQTLGAPGAGTIETEIYTQTVVYGDLQAAASLSCVQVVIVLLAMWVSSRLRTGNETALRMRDDQLRTPGRSDLFAGIVTAMAAALVLAPLVTLLVRSLQSKGEWSLRNYELLSTSGTGFGGGVTVTQALQHSLATATDATIIALCLGIPLGVVLSRRPAPTAPGHRAVTVTQRILDAASTLPLGVSAVVVGFGFLITWQVAAPNLAHSGALVPLAQAVIALPMMVRSIVPVLRAIDPRLREAAATLGASPMRVLRTVDGPVLLRAVGLAAGFAFAISLGEFGATTFLAAPDRVTLPVLIARLLGRPGGDNYGMALAGAVILAAITTLAMVCFEQMRPRQLRHRAPADPAPLTPSGTSASGRAAKSAVPTTAESAATNTNALNTTVKEPHARQ